MRITKINKSTYIKSFDSETLKILEQFDELREIVESNSNGENTHNHNTMYFTKDEVELKLGEKSNTNHRHDSVYYTKVEVLDVISSVVKTISNTSEICISKEPPKNNEKLWIKVID